MSKIIADTWRELERKAEEVTNLCSTPKRARKERFHVGCCSPVDVVLEAVVAGVGDESATSNAEGEEHLAGGVGPDLYTGQNTGQHSAI